MSKPIEILSDLFINPNGVLCREVVLFGTAKYSMINVRPVFDGYDVNGKIINNKDFHWETVESEQTK